MPRKPLPPSQRSKVYKVLLRPAKRRRWEQAARLEGIALQEFVRRAGDERADRVLGPTAPRP
jgi:hypothetical protein